MKLFTTLDDPLQKDLVAFVEAAKHRKGKPLRDHMAQWVLESIIKGECEITGYAVDHRKQKTWLEFTYFREWENAPKPEPEGEWWEASDPGEVRGTHWQCSICGNGFGLDAGWVRWFEHCPTCGALLDTSEPKKYAAMED